MRETLIRSASGLVYVVLLTLAIFWSSYSFLGLFGIFLLLATAEFCNLTNLSQAIPVLLAAVLYAFFVYLPLDALSGLLLAGATLIVSVKCLLFLFAQNMNPIDVQSKYVYLTGYIILPIILLVHIPFQSGFYRPQIILSLFLIIWANDTFAYLVGKFAGRNKLFPRISPKKTVEGFIGGLGFALLTGSLIAWYLVKEPLWIWLITATLVSISGTLGDLVESKFKRLAQVKDSGNIMPGHGGILDRLDSIIFAAPFVFLFFQILHYVS